MKKQKSQKTPVGYWKVPYFVTNNTDIHDFVHRQAVLFDEFPFLVVQKIVFLSSIFVERSRQNIKKIKKLKRSFPR